MRSAHKQHSLKSELATIVGSDYISDDDFALWAVTNDSSPFQGKMPGIIVLPETTDEVAEILKLANLTSTPVIPRGGGASLFGFPKGIPGRNIILQLTRMNKLIEINHENMTVTAQGGMTTGELSYRCWNEGFHIHTVHTPMYTDTIGGLLTGAGGGGPPPLVPISAELKMLKYLQEKVNEGTLAFDAMPATEKDAPGAQGQADALAARQGRVQTLMRKLASKLDKETHVEEGR